MITEEKRQTLIDCRGFDPSVFHDELATEISWFPESDKPHFQTKKININQDGTIEYKNTILGYIKNGGILIIIGAIGIYKLRTMIGLSENFWIISILPIITILFGMLGIRNIQGDNYTINTNAKTVFIKGYLKDEDKEISFDQIHAIQIVGRYRRKSTPKYYLNIIYKNRERGTLTMYSRNKDIRKDAQILAQYLGIPVRDKTRIIQQIREEKIQNYHHDRGLFEIIAISIVIILFILAIINSM